jgi:chromosomal replication initiation ATPase DnaA
MAAANERIPVLVTAGEKIRIAEMAKAQGMSMGEFLRRAAAAYRPSGDEEVLEGMIVQMLETTRQAERAIDDALAYVEASNRRIAEMESRREAR